MNRDVVGVHVAAHRPPDVIFILRTVPQTERHKGAASLTLGILFFFFSARKIIRILRHVSHT